MSKAALLELADLTERAKKADRELDVLIHAELDGRDARWDGHLLLGRSRRAPHDECRLGSIDQGKLSRNFSVAWSSPECPTYTSSLDAAMTLARTPIEAWQMLYAAAKAVNIHAGDVELFRAIQAALRTALRARAEMEPSDA